MDGVWIEAAPFVRASAKACRAAERAALRAGAAGWVVTAGAWSASLAEAWIDLPVRVDLEGLRGRAGGPAEVGRVLDDGADLLGLPVSRDQILDGSTERRIDEVAQRAQEDEVDTVLLLRGADGRSAEAAVRLARATGGILAVSLDRCDEQALDALSAAEELGVFVDGLEFASGFRRGAGAVDRFLGLLHPRAAAELMELCARRVSDALAVERRLQRFFESRFEPVARRAEAQGVERGALLVAVGGWCPELDPGALTPAGLDARGLRQELLEACPELRGALGHEN